MKLLWFFSHIAFISALAISPTEASSDNKTPVKHQAAYPSVVRVTQEITADSNKPADKPSDQIKQSELEKSLPAIVPDAKQNIDQLSSAFQQLRNQS